MYEVTIGQNPTTTIKSYALAKATVLEAATKAAVELSKPVNPRLYRSPKTAATINEARAKSAARLVGLSLPKLAGSHSVSLGGFHATILAPAK